MRCLLLFAGLSIWALGASLQPGSAADREAYRISSAEDWGVYQSTLNGEPLCWVLTTPFEMSSGTATLKPRISYAVGFDQFGITFDGGASPSPVGFLGVGPQEFPMTFRGPHGWLSTVVPDQVFELAAGNQRFAYVSVGPNSFSFSLSGFFEAIGQARRACGLE